MSLRIGLIVVGVLLVVIGGVVALSSGDDEPDRSATTVTAPVETAQGAAPPPKQAAHRRRIQQERRSRAVVSDAYEGLDVIARDWYVRTYANVAAGLVAAQKDAGLEKFCNLMSRAARREVIDYGRATADVRGLKWTCPAGVALLVRRANQRGTGQRLLKARVVGVNLEGRRGTATLDYGKNQPRSTVSLVRESGKWKLGSAGVGN